jgi:hypothetical protein
MYEAIRHETSRKPLTREKPAEFLGTGHQCKDDYCHQLGIIFESVETFIRIVGLYLGGVPLIFIPVLSILWLFYSIQADRAFGTDYCLRFLFVILLS